MEPNPDLELRLVEPGSELHAAELRVRYRLLREPLGMKHGTEVFQYEDECLHVVAVESGRVVGCVVFHPHDKTSGRLRQMAVVEKHQKGGIGRQLVRFLEKNLLEKGYQFVHLHARDLAIGFYQRLGYECYGEPYFEVGIPHQSMRRQLQPKGQDCD